MSVNQTTPARPSFVSQLTWLVFGMLVVAVFGSMLYKMWMPLPAPAPETRAPALVAPTPAPRPTIAAAPVVIPAAPIIVQSVTDGQAPQPVQFQPIPAPAVDSAAPAVEPAPRPLIIVHQVSADGSHQVITGSGACKVTKVAARCSR